MEFAGERSPVVSVGADEAAALQIPGDLDTLGWWQDGGEPGAAEGFVVITGHATQDGGAAANKWWDAEPGDRVVLETDTGTATYRVISRRTYADEDVPLARWFPASGPNGPAGLALITCADYRDAEWRSNLVVEAVPE
jgi:sortase (surface protein transpeptidase)